MRQLTFISPGKFEMWDVPAPTLTADTDAIVRPLTVARCDLDLYIATGFMPYPGPFAFGHEAVAEVIDAGPKARVRPGQRVVVPFQLSCGRCGPCQQGFTNTCEAFPARAAFGLRPTSGTEFGGALSERMLVPFADHMLVDVPDGIDPVAIASAADNIPDGWRAVAPHLKERPGATVLVVGGMAQSVGLYAAGAAVALGAGRVLYLDDDPVRRAAAAKMGAEVQALDLASRQAETKPKPGQSPLAVLGGRDGQFTITVDASGNPDALGFAIASTEPNGICTSVAIYNSPTTPVPLLKMYGKGITFHTGRVHARPALPEILHKCAAGHWHPEHVTTRTASFDEAGDAMTDGGPKLVFINQWS